MHSFETDILFPSDVRTGIIPALDINPYSEREKFERVVTGTADVLGVIGYKFGGLRSLRKGLEYSVQTFQKTVDSLNAQLSKKHKKIFDYQKLGADGEKFMRDMIKDNHDLVDAFIYFPFTGPFGQVGIIEEIREHFKTPIAGGPVTFVGSPESEGGYIPQSANIRMFVNSVLANVPNYVFPASRPEDCELYKPSLVKFLKERGLKPNFFPTGLGKDKQGGDLIKTLDILHPFNTYFIM